LKKIFNACCKGIYKAEFDVYNLASVLQGGIAQLGERLHGMQEVSGSIPLTSTNFLHRLLVPAELQEEP
jgi:hypothetical protein